MDDFQTLEQQYDERVIDIARVAKFLKGGRRFSFRVTLVVGDNNGNIGLGVGKALAVPDAMRKATERAYKNMRPISLHGTTIPHEVTGVQSGSKVFLNPASYWRYRRGWRACWFGSRRNHRYFDQITWQREYA